MKLTTIILLATMLQVSASTFGQKVTLVEKKISLEKVFREITRQTGYDIVYFDKKLNGNSEIEVSFKDTPLSDAMATILQGKNLTFSINKTNVVIKEKSFSIIEKIKEVFSNIDVRGKIVDDLGNPLVGATIKLRGTNRYVQSNIDGNFTFASVPTNSFLQVSYVGYSSKELQVADDKFLAITLIPASENLDSVSVVSTGYQTIPKERATGSFVQIDKKLLNRSVSTNILDRLKGVTSGLIFNSNINAATNSNQSSITIGGRSTIYANPNPLIVIDNFPYNGDLSTINPNDIESITVLKDAAAASIWGAFSGNGVIVITTKKGKVDQTPKIELNSNITIGEKPNLWYSPQLSSNHFIEIETFLFNKGFYNSSITSTAHPVLSPVVDILVNRRNNLISSADSASLINKYKQQDTRSDLSKYFYRQAINQQYSMNISGGGKSNQYYFSTGFDKNLTNLTRSNFDRISISASDTYYFLKNKLQFTNSIYFTKNKTENNGISALNVNYPYLQLRDQNGSSVSVPYQYRQGYVETVGNGNLLDWNYRPIDELNSNNRVTKLTEYRVNSRLQYNILSGLNASLQYQYDQGNSVINNLYGLDSYLTRDLINKFTQYNATTGVYTRPIPLGAILDNSNQNFNSQNVRGQINYEHRWNSNHDLTALAGYEIRDINGDIKSGRTYGYTDLGTSALIDYVNNYTLLYNGGTSRISQNYVNVGTTSRFKSAFANLAYAYKGKYIVSASGRKDQSNIFGVNTNQKGVPLWSAGASWEIDKEKFYHVSWLPYIRLRITNGYQGNIDNSLSALITALASPNNNIFGSPYSTLSNPPNPELRWEKVNTTNIGADFSLKKTLSGSIEYYFKKATDLIGTSAIDPTTGVSTFKGNSANMSGKGIDINLTSKNIRGKINWNTTLLVSYTKNRVTKYLLKPTTIGNALSTAINPLEGNPLYSLYSLKWGGLDNVGDPQVYYKGVLSKNYSELYNSSDLSNLKYEGNINPTIFGSVRNDLSWKQFTISINIVYKLGYYFRRPGFNYSSILSGNTGSLNFSDKDFVNRWQKPGDESKTDVPALLYPANNLRDQVYKYSSLFIEKGDHIRLQDINVSYEFNINNYPKLPFKTLQIYSYINNIGLLWKANKANIDPDYVPNDLIFPNPRTYSLGLRIGF